LKWFCCHIFSDIREDFVHPKLQSKFGRPVLLDIYLPNLNLAFEYQGEQHYADVFRFAPHKYYAQRDEQKRKLCKMEGITLIEIPFWWDFQAQSLAATISSHCSDFNLKITGNVIPSEPPRKLEDGKM
jgi:hypothetical protein